MIDKPFVGQRVIYVPSHANGDINHKDAEHGVVKDIVNSTCVRVNYIRNGILQKASQLTRNKFLYT